MGAMKIRTDYSDGSNSNGYRKFVHTFWFTQPRPYRQPLFFRHMVQKGVGYDSRYDPPNRGSVGPGSILYTTLAPEYPYNGSPSYNAAYKIAYDRFVAKVKSSQSLGLALLEARESIGMVAARTTQLISAFRKCRKGDFAGLMSDLTLSSRHPKAVRALKRSKAKINPKSPSYIRDESKRAASTWLEWTFGWSPLIKDIGGAVEALQREFPSEPITGSGSGTSDEKVGQWPYGPGDYVHVHTLTKVRIKALMHVSNPNLLLANELGFVNPAQIAWEAVPFSFLVDAFIPINRFLGSFTDLAGVSLDRLFITASRQAQGDSFWSYGSVSVSKEESGYGIQRSVPSSLPIPGLLDRVKFPTPDLGRAVTLTSLAIQVFSGSSR